VAVAPQGNLIASASSDRTVRLWSTNLANTRSSVIKSHTGTVRSVQFSSDNASLLTASDDKTVKIWAIQEQKFRHTLHGHTNWVRTASMSPDCSLVASGGDDKTVRLWDCRSRACVHTFYDHTATVNSVVWHPSGNCFASGSSDQTVKVWDARTMLLLQHYPAHMGSVNSLAFHPCGNFLLSGSSDSTVKVWDVQEGHLFYTLRGHTGPVNCVAFSPLGDFFCSSGDDTNLMVWKTNFDAKQGSQRPRSAPSPSRAVADSSLSSRSSSRGGAPTRVSNSPGAHVGSSSFHAADESKYERDVRAEFDAAAEEVDVYDCGSAPSTWESSVLRASQSPQRAGVGSGVRGGSIAPPHVQTSAAHARRYHGAAAVAAEESGAADIHVSRATISSGLDSRNTQVLEHVLQQLGALTDMMSLVQQRMQVTEERINAIEGRRRAQANPNQSTRDWLSANHAL